MIESFELKNYVEGSIGQQKAEEAFNRYQFKWLEVSNTHTITDHNAKWTAFITDYEGEHGILIRYLRDT